MPGSALFGHPPNNQDDWYIIRGLARFSHIPDKVLDPKKGFPIHTHRPPNFHYASRGPGIIASAAVTIVLVIAITGTRLGLRFFRRDLKWGLDDYFIIPAALLTIVFLAVVISEVTNGGLGKHIYDLTYQEVNWLFQAFLLTVPVFWMIAGMIKISIIFFNRRLTGLTSHRWMMAHYAFLVLVIGFMIAALFTELCQCRGPVNLKYSLRDRGRYPTNVKCLDGNKLGYGIAIVHSFLDFCLLCVPLIVLYQMKMTLSKKVRLGFLFSVGLVSCVGSVMRQVVQNRNYKNPDTPWVYKDDLSWVIVDLFFGITAASLPVLNAAIPKRWRSSPNRTPQLNHLSIFDSNSTPKRSVTTESSDRTQRPDGTQSADAGKDSYHHKTEKRWDDAYVGVQRPDAARTTSFAPKRSDDTLV